MRTDESEELLDALVERRYPGVLVVGPPGIGKSTLLLAAAEELRSRKRVAFVVPLSETRNERDVGALILRTVFASSSEGDAAARLPRSSIGELSIAEVASELDRVGRGRRPVLLLDGLDKALLPQRVASVIAALSGRLDDWQFVVSSRPQERGRLELPGFHVLEMRGLRPADVERDISTSLPGLSAETLRQVGPAVRRKPAPGPVAYPGPSIVSRPARPATAHALRPPRPSASAIRR